MKVVAFNGSARKEGNTDILLNLVLDELKRLAGQHRFTLYAEIAEMAEALGAELIPVETFKSPLNRGIIKIKNNSISAFRIQ